MTSRTIPATQRAVQLVGPDQLKLNDAKPVPEPGPHQVLCEVVVVGLCFSDLKLLKQFAGHVRKSEVISGIDPTILRECSSYVPGDRPTVPGHEPVVRVVKVGAAVRRFKPGERYFIQADWRWLRTAGSNGAFGYNFEGALQEYVLLDDRIIVAPDGDSMLLPAPEGGRSASAFGLVEPWACVECSYLAPERRTLTPGGRVLVVADAGADTSRLATLWAGAAVPVAVTWVSAQPAPEMECAVVTAVPSLATVPAEQFDDVLYFGADAAVAEQLFAKAAKDGLILLLQCGGRFGRPVQTALGGIHYRGLRLGGTPGADPAEALARIPATGEIRPGDRVHVVGAGGPMGVMHIVRNLCQGVPGVTVVAADLSDERLETLSRIAAPLAKECGTGYEPYNSTGGGRPGPFHYSVIMAPVPALVAGAVPVSAPGAIINIFAGIPVDKNGPVDLDQYVAKGLFFIGTSGSRMEDMRVVLQKVESGRLNTNVSVAAVSGLDGAVDGIRAVEKQAIPGKIMVYPACRGLPLTTLEELRAALPQVHGKLAGGLWTKAAEDALLAQFAG